MTCINRGPDDTQHLLPFRPGQNSFRPDTEQQQDGLYGDVIERQQASLEIMRSITRKVVEDFWENGIPVVSLKHIFPRKEMLLYQ